MTRRLLAIITILSLYILPLSASTRVGATSPKNSKPAQSSCVPCQANAKSNNPVARLDKLASLGHRTQVSPFKQIPRSVFEGGTVNMVGTSSGQVSFSITDLTVSGTPPIKFQRVYASGRTEDTGLGTGWSFGFDDRIKLSAETARLITGDGSTTNFIREGQGQRFVSKPDEPSVHQSFNLTSGDTIIEQVAEGTRTYKKLGDTFRLSRIAAANGGSIEISFDANGNIVRIASSGGGALVLEWSNKQNAQLLSVTDNAGRRVSFRQDSQRLRAVTDPAGAQWEYEYQAGRLTRAGDPVGRTLLAARYDARGRVIAIGDAAGTTLYDYDANSSAVSRRTVVTDPLGVKTIFNHTERGTLASVIDDQGRVARVEYNAFNRPVRKANSLGDEMTFVYDAQNRLVHQSSTDGTERAFTYDEQNRVTTMTDGADRIDFSRDALGNVNSTKSTDPARSVRSDFDARGQRKAISTEAGLALSFEQDAAGNTVAVTDPQLGRLELLRDSAGRIITERSSLTGLMRRYEYDARGMISKQSDEQGNSITVERDASGAKIGLVSSKGEWVRATRDQAGRIVALTSSNGKSRYFAYDARGALIDTIDARGKHSKLDYDQRGRLRTITDDQGNKTEIKRDERGRAQGLSLFRMGWRYDYDQEGRFLAARQVRSGAVQFISASYNMAARPAVSPASLLMANCLYDDNFYSSELIEQPACDDPFEGGGTYDPITYDYEPVGGFYDVWYGDGYDWYGDWYYGVWDSYWYGGYYDYWYGGWYGWYDPWFGYSYYPWYWYGYYYYYYYFITWRCIQAKAVAYAAVLYASYVCSRGSPACPAAVDLANRLLEYARIVCGSGV
jgi:YD repeat-containing protein